MIEQILNGKVIVMKDYSVEVPLRRGAFDCPCGRRHEAHLKKAVVKSGAIEELTGLVEEFGGGKAFILCDANTFAAAGVNVLKSLTRGAIGYTIFQFPEDRTEPDEKAVGAAVLHFDYTCDIIVGVGAGVINDIGKILAKMTGLPYIIVATAPSMDGFASSTSSVVRNGLKVSVDSKCPDAVIGDTDVLKEAPEIMLQAGLGDMLAKSVSVCEWRIGHIVTGEYYCDVVAAMIRAALNKCVKNAGGLMQREPDAVETVMKGLIISGIAADYAGVSRPVSGVEHYFSHLWDMRALEFGTPWSLHGVQCGIGTVLALRGYERLSELTPDREKALAAFRSMDRDAWFGTIKEYLGGAADAILETAPRSARYSEAQHEKRLANIVDHWDEILQIIREELPPAYSIYALLKNIGAPAESKEIGIPTEENALTFKVTKDIRDKYILSTLLFDMGLLDEEAERCFSQQTPFDSRKPQNLQWKL